MSTKARILPWLICGLGALFYCYEYFLRIGPSVMAPQLMQTFNVDAFAFGNLAAFYYYAYTPMQLPVGVLMDRYGPRRLLAFAALICAVGSYWFAHGNLTVAHAGRFLVGFGSAFAFVGVLKLATIWLPPSRFAMVAGMVTSLGMLGAMGGDYSLGYLVKNMGWQPTIYLSAISGVVLAVVLFLFIPEHDPQEKITQKPPGFGQLMDELLELIQKPQMWMIGLVGLSLYLSLSVFAELWGVPYLARAYDVSNIRADHIISAIFLGWAIGGPLAGYISDKFKNRRYPLIIGSALGIVFVSIILYLPDFSRHHLNLLFFLFGVATSVESIIFAVARELNPPNLAGTSVAFTNLFVMLGGVLFQPLLGSFLDKLSSVPQAGNLNAYSAQDFQHAMFILPASLLLAVIVMMFVKETHAELGEEARVTD